MAKEIELKLSLPSEAVVEFLADPLLSGLSTVVVTEPEQHLENQYFDTPDLDLNQARAALRIRTTENGYIQTLKSKGNAVAGLHQRGEWECEIPRPELDWSLMPDEVQIDEAIRGNIQPLFKTDFQRHIWRIQLNNSQIELVLDQGTISTEKRAIPLCEVELELTSGNVEDLFELACELTARHPLVPCDINKAERGYGLIKPGLHFYEPAKLDAAHPDLHLMLSDGLNRISRRWDEYLYGQDWWRLMILQRQISGVVQLLKALPNTPEAILAQWQELSCETKAPTGSAQTCVGLFLDRNMNSRGLSQRILETLKPELIPKLSAWVNQNHLGQAMVSLGQWLYGQANTETRQQMRNRDDALWSQLDTEWQRVTQRKTSNLDQQLADIESLQGLAYCFERLDDPRYEPLGTYIDLLMVVAGMRHSEQIVNRITDVDSRAKLASWNRRITVELRDLLDAYTALSDGHHPG